MYCMKTFAKKTFWLLALVSWMGIIFYLSSIPSLQSGFSWDFFLRKGAHMTEYAILTFLAYKNLSSKNITKRRQYVAAFLFTLLYAGSDEIHQRFVAGRHGTPFDLLYDLAGAAIMIWLITLWPRICAYAKGRK